MDTSDRPVNNKEDACFDEPIKIDFLKPDKLLRPAMQEHASPMKSSPLKRSDGVMDLEAAGFGSPRHKRRSLHGASTFGHDFNVFDQGLDGNTGDASDMLNRRSSDEKEREPSGNISSTWPTQAMNSPQRRAFGLRKSTLQQRAGGQARSRLFPDANREAAVGLSPALTRARSRMSLDSALPLRGIDFTSPFNRNVVGEAPSLFPPPAQKPYQSAPKPHPLSHALTPYSSGSSMADKSPQNKTNQQPPRFQSVLPNQDFMPPPKSFSHSLPIGAARPTRTTMHQSGQESSEESSFATPEAFKMAKPLPQAFHSTGLISKRNRNVDIPPAHFASSHMPDTPSKKAAHMHLISSPAPSALGKMMHPTHEFGSPSTPLGGRASKAPPESFGQNVNIFGSRVNAPQLTRRGSFLSVDGDDISTSPTRRLQSQASTDDLPPTPTKSTATATVRPQSKGKSNSLRSSLFGRRTSLGPDSFASPADEQTTPHDDATSKSNILIDTPRGRLESRQADMVGDKAMPSITLTACGSPSPSMGRQRSYSHDNVAASPTPLGRRPQRSVPHLRTRSGAFTKTSTLVAPEPTIDEGAEKTSPHTPHDSFMPPDPSNLSISAEHRPTTSLGHSITTFPPATPTGPRDSNHTSGFFPGHQSSSYFANDVDTSLTSRFGKVAVSGNGEFSQVYKVEKALAGTLQGSRAQLSPSAQVWAVKKSRKPYTGQKDRQRKMREVQILKALQGHENIVEFVDHWEAKNHLYIQTEFCENGNMKDFLLRTGFKGRLDDFRIWKILLETALGLRSIHDAGFMHLDLKPANILIDWEGVLKIADFGMASEWPAPANLDGEGDREYIGPEVLAGRFDKPADIFALGMMMLEIAGNIVLPDNGMSWQRLRAGDTSELPSLTWTSDSSLPRDASGDPVEMQGLTSFAAPDLSMRPTSSGSNAGEEMAFLRPTVVTPNHRRKSSRDLVTPPNFMVDQRDPDALDQVVQWMIAPDPAARPTVDGLLNAGGVQWVDRRRRAGATVYEGSWGPADVVVQGLMSGDGAGGNLEGGSSMGMGEVEMLDF